MIKILRKLEIEVNFLNTIGGIHEKFTANIIFNSKRLKAFLLGKRQRFLLSRFSSTGASSHRNHAIKRNKRHESWGKKEVKLPLFEDDIILYTENHKEFTKILQEAKNKFRSVHKAIHQQ